MFTGIFILPSSMLNARLFNKGYSLVQDSILYVVLMKSWRQFVGVVVLLCRHVVVVGSWSVVLLLSLW